MGEPCVSPHGLSYSVTGTGPPLLWLCGYVVGASSFDHVVERFADRFTCITFDHRGSGLTKPSLRPLSTRAMAHDALGLLDDLALDSSHIMGLSLGGMVAQELAALAPSRVRSLVLGATTAGGVGAESPSWQTLIAELKRAHTGVPGAWRVGLRGVVNQGWAAATHDMTSRLDRIEVPTLVIHGENDVLVPVGNAAVLAELIPQAELMVVPDGGHLFIYDSESANGRVLAWLDERRDLEPPADAPDTGGLADLVAEPFRCARAQLLPARRSWRSLAPRF